MMLPSPSAPAGADGDGSINLGRDSLNTLEQVDDINRSGNIRQRRVALASEDGAAVGGDRNDVIALLLQIVAGQLLFAAAGL